MKRLGYVVVGALATTALAVGTSFGAGPGASGPRDAIWGGGYFEGTVGGYTFIHDFSVTAEQGRSGGADGSFVYGRNGVGTLLDTAPSCISVSGNKAVIAGVESASGFPWVWYVVDNGTPVSTTRDQVTPVDILSPAEIAQLPAGSLPTGFPSVCPTPNAPIAGLPYLDATGGDVVVRDAPAPAMTRKAVRIRSHRR